MGLPKTKNEAIELLQSGKELTTEEREAIVILFSDNNPSVEDWEESTEYEDDWANSSCSEDDWSESQC